MVMVIDVLVCRPDGTQVLERQEVPEDYYDEPTPEPTAQDDTDALLVDHELRLTLLELGVM